ncbi:MAG: hypothetical protein PHN74_01475 [Candidatus Pacebacteria bacterium]|nr:hypothetical protein [Candidatus Paceibacterota bacterium]
MKKSEYILKSFINAVGVFVYVFAVALMTSNGETIFGKEHNILVPIFMLLLFIVSASVTILLILGRPVYLYLNGLKKEAIILLLATLAWLVVFIVTVVIVSLLK